MGDNKPLPAILVNLWSSARSWFGRIFTQQPQPPKSERNATSPEAIQKYFDDDDDGYEAFVDLMCRQPGIDLKRIRLERVWRSGEVFSAELIRLVESNDRLYINLYEGGIPKAHAADNRHTWCRNGTVIDSSAFQAIKLGIDPGMALGPDPRPASWESALDPGNNRVSPVGRSFVICYTNAEGEISYRVISQVVRGADCFSARCHFRWGERRRFLYERLLEVRDANTGETIELEDFRSNKSAANKMQGRHCVGRHVGGYHISSAESRKTAR
jgi:hypothetical protein